MCTSGKLPAVLWAVGRIQPVICRLEELRADEGLVRAVPLDVIPDDLAYVEAVPEYEIDIPVFKPVAALGEQLPPVQLCE